MKKFPLIEAMGLTIKTLPHSSIQLVYAEDLERALEAAPVVYGTDGGDCWVHDTFGNDDHTARLLLVTPIKRMTREEKALKMLEMLVKHDGLRLSGDMELAKEILEGE